MHLKNQNSVFLRKKLTLGKSKKSYLRMHVHPTLVAFPEMKLGILSKTNIDPEVTEIPDEVTSQGP